MTSLDLSNSSWQLSFRRRLVTGGFAPKIIDEISLFSKDLLVVLTVTYDSSQNQADYGL